MIYDPWPLPGYDYSTELFLQDDFLNQSATSGTIGNLGFSALNGTTTVQSPTGSRPGIVRRSTSASINTVATMKLGTSAESFLASDHHRVLWVVRINDIDALTAVRIGSFSNSVADPFPHGIYLEKLNADTNWHAVCRASNVQTRVVTGVAITTGWITVEYIRYADGVQWYLGASPGSLSAVGSLITTNIPTAVLHPGTCIINGEAVAKTMDHTYFEFHMWGLSR